MNEKIILGMVQPYLDNQKITYDEFEKIFDMLSIKEQYGVVNILENNGIELVAEKETKIESETLQTHDQDFDILYNDDIFLDDYDSDQNVSEYKDNKVIDGNEISLDQQENLIIRKVIKMSNETLIRLIQEGNTQAKQDLCIKNKGLVDKSVHHYMKLAGNKLDFEDLEQIGMMGMLKAAEKFDFSVGTTFSTYATFWINQSILREICDNGFTIRIPVHKMDQIFKVCRLDSKLLSISDYHERIKAISNEAGLKVETVEDCLKLYYTYLRPASLDMPVGEEEETSLGDLITIKDDILPENIVSRKICREDLESVMSILRDKEQTILRLRLGWDDGCERTLEEIGTLFNVTRERIRQIEEKALRKLRNSYRNKRIEGYLEDL